MTTRSDARSLARATESVRCMGVLDERATVGLDAALLAGFEDTQARAHVLTGALKASGRSSSSSTSEEWRGRIAYGGTPGTDHVIYETARGGDHDFMAGLDTFEDDFELAVVEAVRRTTR